MTFHNKLNATHTHINNYSDPTYLCCKLIYLRCEFIKIRVSAREGNFSVRGGNSSIRAKIFRKIRRMESESGRFFGEICSRETSPRRVLIIGYYRDGKVFFSREIITCCVRARCTIFARYGKLRNRYC